MTTQQAATAIRCYLADCTAALGPQSETLEHVENLVAELGFEGEAAEDVLDAAGVVATVKLVEDGETRRHVAFASLS